MTKRSFRYYIRACASCTPVKECRSHDEVRTFANDYPHYFLVDQQLERSGGLLLEPTGKTWSLSHFRKQGTSDENP